MDSMRVQCRCREFIVRLFDFFQERDGVSLPVLDVGSLPKGSRPAAFERMRQRTEIRITDSFVFWGGNICNKLEKRGKMGKIISV